MIRPARPHPAPPRPPASGSAAHLAAAGVRTRRELLAQTRRLALLLAGTGLWPAAAQGRPAWPAAAFGAQALAEVYPALGLPLPEPSAQVSVRAPALAEDGASVAVSASTTLAGARRLLLLVEHNPVPLAAVFELGPALAPGVALRVKMAQDTAVYAVAVRDDGRAFYARQAVAVALGGCGQTN